MTRRKTSTSIAFATSLVALVMVAGAQVGAAVPHAAAASAPAEAPGAALTPVTQSVAAPPRWFQGDDGQVHLQYELLLTNTVPIPADVQSVEVRGDGRTLRRLTGDELAAALAPLGSEAGTGTALAPSSVGVVWVDLDLPSPAAVPAQVSHRLTIDVGGGLPVGPEITTTGARAAVTTRAPVVIDRPLRGGPWVAIGGADGPHRRGLQPIDGRLRLSQRYALDFSALLDDDDRTHAGDPGESASYFAYGQDVLAVGAGTVVAAVDRYVDQIPNRHVALPSDEQDGNHVIIRLEPGVYAGYAHLAPGSVRVEPGDRVRTGQVIGRLGNTGASTGPHLHFQVMNRPSILAADGLPFTFSRFTFDGTIPSLEGFIDADATGGRVAMDDAGAGPRRHQGEAGISVLTFAGHTRRDVAAAVDVGGGRRIYAECRGTGSPTVVLISGKGNGARDWHQVLDAADPVREVATDEVLAGAGDIRDHPTAVFPTTARDTRVCTYDRPNTRADGVEISTPRAQPHGLDQDVDDLHRVLERIDAPGPYVLVAHSYGGFIAELYARRFPKQVSGLVMVDAGSSYIARAITPTKLGAWDRMNRVAAPGQESVRIADAITELDAAPPLRRIPSVVLTADKSLRADLTPADADASVTFDDWLVGQRLLANGLAARQVTATHSGHNVYLYSPRLVSDAIRDVVAEVRAGGHG